MRTQRLLALAAAACATLAATGYAQLPLTTVDTPVLVDLSTFAGAGFSPTPSVGQLDSNIWAVDSVGTTNVVPFGGTADANSAAPLFEFARGFQADALNIPTGGTGRGLWGTVTGTTRGIFFVLTGNDNAPRAVKLRAQNNTGSTLSGITVDYDVWFINDAPRANSFNLWISQDNVTYTPVSSASVVTAEVAVDPRVFEQADAPSPSRTATISGLSILPGQFVYLRWSVEEVSGSGNRDKFALSNVSVTPRAGGNSNPVVSNGAVSNTRPTTADSLLFTVEATDVDGTITDVTLFTSNDGATYTANTMTGVAPNFSFNLGTVANRTPVFYYFEATDNNGATTALFSASEPALVYVTDDRPIVGEIVINEICHTQNTANPPGQPSGDWVELFNSSNREIDLSLTGIIDDAFARVPSRFPVGTIIPPNGFVVMAQNPTAFSNYGPWGSFITPAGQFSFGLGGNGDSVILLNDIDEELDRVDYLNGLLGWPTIIGASGEPASERGFSIELIDPLLDNNEGTNWRRSATVDGTPGRVNSAATVDGWMMY